MSGSGAAKTDGRATELRIHVSQRIIQPGDEVQQRSIATNVLQRLKLARHCSVTRPGVGAERRG